jgi:membrane protease YdiL (CAAX protease family)
MATLPQPSVPSPPSYRPLLAWAVIVALAGLILVRNAQQGPSGDPAARRAALLIEARGLVGLARLRLAGEPLTPPAALYEQARAALERGPYGQRLRVAVLAGELVGPEEARAVLRRLAQDREVEPTPEEQKEAGVLARLYSGRPLSEGQRQLLRDRLGWFGRLALTPEGADPEARAEVLAPALRTAQVYVAVLVLGGTLVLAGGLVLLVLVVLTLAGRLSGGLRTGRTPGGVYAETFALYMTLFLALSYAGRWIPAGRWGLLLSGLAALVSLTALAWPVLRGVPWQQVRADVGWHRGRAPGLEPLFGLVGYLAAVPLLLVGLLATVVLVFLRRQFGGPDPFGPDGAPTHPILGVALGADVWVWLQVFFLASVVAPLVEETMFRGVLYRHLREGLRRLRPAFAVLLAALFSSFLFAAIHPQGLLGVPPLLALAFSFALVREWRDTVVPTVVAHGVHNGLLTLVLWLLTS